MLMKARVLFTLLLFTSLFGESLDEVMDGFEEEPEAETLSIDEDMAGFEEEEEGNERLNSPSASASYFTGFTGKLTQQIAYSYKAPSPHNIISSFKSSILLDYEHKFDNGIKFKTNAKVYYDSIYTIRDNDYTKDEIDAYESEIRLYDAYVQGKIADNLDFKVGNQVVVWGRSDTIRITDILNPLDNRRPALVDIEDLRLSIPMVKLDYFVGNWRVTPMAILQQQFSLNPPIGSLFNPSKFSLPKDESYTDISPALSIGGEFSGWDINFYGARVRDDRGVIKEKRIKHDYTNMVGIASNILKGSWLFKSEFAYFDRLKYTTIPTKMFQRVDSLVGVEYNGIPDTVFSYDISLRKILNYDNMLIFEPFEVEKDTYQQAFRVTSDFINATLHTNYLLSLVGKKLDKGGFQRAWIEYDIGDRTYLNLGVVDYISGSSLFDTLKNSDMLFADINYEF